MRISLPIFASFVGFMATAYTLSGQPIPSNALSFDGSDDYVLSTAQGASGNSARTIEAWIKTTANCIPGAGGGVQQTIVDWGTFATGARFTFNLLWANAPRIEVGGNGLSGVTAVNDGYWHHVAVVYDPNASNTYKLYVDGQLDAQGNLTISTNTTSGTSIQIGKRVDGNNPFTGEIDEVRIWNTARTSSQISSNYNKELCGLSIPASLVVYYKANQGIASGSNSTVNILYDAGNFTYGTLYNFALTGSSSNWVAGAPLPGGKDTTLSASACASYTDPLGNTYTTSGTYTYAYTMANGCDSTVHLQLTIDTVDTGVTQTGSMQVMNLLTANASNGSYQWVDCANGYAPISGATSQSYTANANGSYAVIVTQNGCTDTSACYTVAGIGIRESAPAQIVLIPNPSKGTFTVDLGQTASKANVEIWDVMGRRVFQKSSEGVQRVPIQTKLSPGVYLVKVQANGQSVTRRMVIE